METERLALEKIESAAREKERAERERLAREEVERVRTENLRLFQERESERLERERIAREEALILRAEQERLAAERAEAERIEREKRAEAARIEKERQALERAERERIAREQADRIRADQERLAAERAEAERIEREQRAEAVRIEKERQAREKAEGERVKAEQAALEAERKRIAREEAAAEKARKEQARRAEEERLALEFAQRRRREQEEVTRLRAERRRISDEQEATAQAEKAGRKAERPQGAGWASRLGAWLVATPAVPPDQPAADPRWSMVVSPEEPPTPISSAVAEGLSSWNDAPMTDPIRETDETPESPAAPEPSPSTPDEAPIVRVPMALVELNELVERESAASRKSGAVPSESESLADAKPAARGGGGRSAQMLAGDAADDRARDRHLNWGRGEPPPETLKGDDEPHVKANPEIVAPPAARRRGSGRTVALFFILATATTAAMMTSDRWLPLLFGEPQTPPVATGPAPQIKSSAPAVRPAPVAAAPEVPQAASPAVGQIAPSTPSVDPITNQTIAALMARIATLEAALGNTVRLEEINRRVNALAGRSADASSVLALSDRVAALEQAGRSAADARATAVALTIAAVQWRDAVVTGRPFLKEWDTVKALTGETKTNSLIAKYASAGLPTLAELQRRFDAVAAGTVRANCLPDDTTGWVRRTLERIFSVVTIRRTDVDVGDDVEAVLVRADRAVDVGDLARAVGEMKKLTGAPLAAAALWIELAEARETAEQAAHKAVIAAAAALAVPPQTPTPPKAE